jgi:outer membrane protein assembly factor BamB
MSKHQDFVYVGIKGHVVALHPETGHTVWTVQLPKGMTFVPILRDGKHLYAASGGEITCLDARSGEVLWHNPLKGLGRGFASFSSDGSIHAAAAAIAAAQAAAAASHGVGGAGSS